MPRIQRSDLERPLSPSSMRRLVRKFALDRETYPDVDVHNRVGIVKTILEEYHPLTTLVTQLRYVRSAHLTPKSTEGPDAEIRFWLGRRTRVQITVANQNYDTRLQREELRAGNPVFTFQLRRRDKATGKILKKGSSLIPPEHVVVNRVQRIRQAIEKKCIAYRRGTEVLLIADESAHWRYLEHANFIKRVSEMFGSLKNVPYDTVYVCFGDAVVNLSDGHNEGSLVEPSEPEGRLSSKMDAE